MDNTQIKLSAGTATWYSYPCETIAKDTIHFSPANGILADSYRLFFKELNKQYAVNAMDCRAAWPDAEPPKEQQRWEDLANDLIEVVEQQYSRPVIGMGHSLGGVLTLMAAAKRPELFSKIVVIDGASLPNFGLSLVYDFLPKWWSVKNIPLVASTYKRRKVWDSREQFSKYHLGKSAYKNFDTQCMHDYAMAGLREREDGKFELVYSREWEAFIFRRIKYLWSVAKKVKVPVHLLRAEYGHLYTQEQFDSRCAGLPKHITSAVIPGLGHLATHENPVITAESVLAYLSRG